MEKINTKSQQFPPVISVLGHVDHGKTSLLDAIRKTSIAEREFGGITQKIGASAVEIAHDGKKRWLTFIDTPGHEAFSKMRGRGAQVADIGLLIVSAVDGVMPQTKESIELLKQAAIPYIVVLTKADLPTKQTEKVKQQLLKEGIMLEGLGGDVPFIEVSAKTNLHIKELLELILLVYDIHIVPVLTRSQTAPLEGVIIESKMDPRIGPRATVVIKNGRIKARDEATCEGVVFRVRSLMDDRGKTVQEASVGHAVEVMGFTKVPGVGSLVSSKDAVGKSVAEAAPQAQLTRELVYKRVEQGQGLAVVLCTDSQGSLEAILHALPKGVQLVSQKAGDIAEADILLAKSTGAIVLGFNVPVKPDIQRLAVTEKVLVRTYNIIYEMLTEISDVIEGKRLDALEQVYGQAQIMASFPFEKTVALGIKVLDGRVARGDKVRVMRGDESVGEATIASLRVGKNTTSKVEKGQEAGIVINPSLDFRVGDMLICHN